MLHFNDANDVIQYICKHEDDIIIDMTSYKRDSFEDDYREKLYNDFYDELCENNLSKSHMEQSLYNYEGPDYIDEDDLNEYIIEQSEDISSDLDIVIELIKSNIDFINALLNEINNNTNDTPNLDLVINEKDPISIQAKDKKFNDLDIINYFYESIISCI